tara:strand:- start:365 stop:889 length:525 start_codon:yes stop_codon:yes gene_type:complete
MKNIIQPILIIVTLVIFSCSNLPSDLEEKKDKLNVRIENLHEEFEKASATSEFERLINEYEVLISDNQNYVNELNERGLAKEVNTEVIGYLNDQISNSREAIQKNKESSNKSYSNSSSTSTKTCSWCSKQFSGSHYTHLGKLAPCQSSSSSNSIGKYCSMKCCSEARRKSCPTC